MADYIYLMQNRLTPAQWRALEAVREAARTHNMPVFLVGGAVRDLTSGAPVRDLDFAVQGEARALVSELEGRGAVIAGEHPVLSSAYFTFRGGVRAEIGPTLSVSYPKPGKPEARTAAILDDLRRRDFTANAMAVSLNEGSYGLLLDPLNGTADIENRELRLVSPYGFIEQPALLLRAARLSDRLGWSLEEKTQGRYETSKEEEHIKALPAWDRSYELEEIFHEEDPLAAMEHMEAEGWREVFFPALDAAGADRGGMDEVRELIGQLESQKLYPYPAAVYFPLITAKLSEENRASLKKLFARQGFVRQIETLEPRGKELANQLTAKSTPLASDAWKLLTGADPEVVLWLAYGSRSAAVQTRIKAFLRDWPGMRQKIPYALMQEMRITPELPGYEQLLDDLFFALIDGKLDTQEATRAFLEPFSPPAPPQVSVRRRPAKSAKGRGKRAAEPVASEPEELEETEDSQDPADSADSDKPDVGRENEEPETGLPAPVALSLAAAAHTPGELPGDTETLHGSGSRGPESKPKGKEQEALPETTPARQERPVSAPRVAAAHSKTAVTEKSAAVPTKPAVTKVAAPAKSRAAVKAVELKGTVAKTGGGPATGHGSAKAAGKGLLPSKTPSKLPEKTPGKAVQAAKPAAKVETAKKPVSKSPVVAAKAQAKKPTPTKIAAKTASSSKPGAKLVVKGKVPVAAKVAVASKPSKSSKSAKAAKKGKVRH